MEARKKRYEEMKESILMQAKMLKEIGFANGQTYENIVENADEYAVREIIALANLHARWAQKVSNGELIFETAKAANPYGQIIPKEIQSSLDKLISSSWRSYKDIFEFVRGTYIGCFAIPSKYYIVTREEYEAAQKYDDDLWKNRMSNYYDDFDYRTSMINAKHDLRAKKLMYKGCNPFHDRETLSSIEASRIEELEKLEQEFSSGKTAQSR